MAKGTKGFPRIDMNEIRRIKKLVDESRDHNRHTCNCEGCKYWWTIPVKMGAAGFIYEVFPVNEKKHTPLSFYHEHKMMLGLVMDEKIPKLHFVWFMENQFIMRFV